MTEFVVNHYSILIIIKHLILILLGAIGGGLFTILIIAFYVSNAEFREDVVDTSFYTDKNPKKLILPKSEEKLSYASIVYTMSSILHYHFFGKRIKNRKLKLRENHGKRRLLAVLLVLVLSIGYSVYGSYHDHFSPDPKELTEFFLRDAEVDEKYIQDITDNGYILIQTKKD